jgi:hypothetical protein
MFTDRETAGRQRVEGAMTDPRWTAIAVGFLRVHERRIAVTKIAEAIRWCAHNLQSHSDPLIMRLNSEGLDRADFDALALTFVHAAEMTHPGLVVQKKTAEVSH